MASAHFKKARAWGWLPQYAPLGALALLVIVIIGVGQYSPGSPVPPLALVDDWRSDASQDKREVSSAPLMSLGLPSTKQGLVLGVPSAAPRMMSEMRAGDNMGFSVGGAKDIANFRENIKQGYLPLPTDITYEGLFYDYYFATGVQEECKKLFCPSYVAAVSADPVSKNSEYFLSVGLNSGMKAADFQRKKLNLVVVLDVSGSMDSPFDQYYYDRFGNQQQLKLSESKQKLEVAKESIVAMLKHLKPDDKFGLVLFSDSARVAKPLNLVGTTDMEKIKAHIMELRTEGGTYMEAGMKAGTELFAELKGANPAEYENRIIFLTDAMPNMGDTSENGLLGITQANAASKLYATFVGIGIDFNTQLVEAITKIHGANYYSVHSSREFSDRLDKEFEYMVTPLVFNLALTLESKGYEIVNVYGSPEANLATGTLMKVNTLFPSSTQDSQTKGGVVLLQLRKISDDASLTLKTSNEDRTGAQGNATVVASFGNHNPEYFGNNGIRKAVLLTRYANLMKSWIMSERSPVFLRTTERSTVMPSFMFPVRPESNMFMPPCGIIPPDDNWYNLNQWERQSMPLRVSPEYQNLFRNFAAYFEREMNALGDTTLAQELDILKKLQGAVPVPVPMPLERPASPILPL